MASVKRAAVNGASGSPRRRQRRRRTGGRQRDRRQQRQIQPLSGEDDHLPHRAGRRPLHSRHAGSWLPVAAARGRRSTDPHGHARAAAGRTATTIVVPSTEPAPIASAPKGDKASCQTGTAEGRADKAGAGKARAAKPVTAKLEAAKPDPSKAELTKPRAA